MSEKPYEVIRVKRDPKRPQRNKPTQPVAPPKPKKKNTEIVVDPNATNGKMRKVLWAFATRKYHWLLATEREDIAQEIALIRHLHHDNPDDAVISHACRDLRKALYRIAKSAGCRHDSNGYWCRREWQCANEASEKRYSEATRFAWHAP